MYNLDKQISKEPLKINFSQNLEKIRRKNKITQDELAYLIGVSRQTIYKWEADICLPNLKKIQILLEVLDVTIEQLLF